DRGIEEVQRRIASNIPRRIAKRRAENGLGDSGVGNIAYLVIGNRRSRSITSIYCIQADELGRGKAATGVELSASITGENSYAINRGRGIPQERPCRRRAELIDERRIEEIAIRSSTIGNWIRQERVNRGERLAGLPN